MSKISDDQIESKLSDAIEANNIQNFEQQFSLSFYIRILKQVKEIKDNAKQIEALEATFIQLNSAEQKMLQYAFKQLSN